MFRIVALSHCDISPAVFALPIVAMSEWADFSARAALIRKEPDQNAAAGPKKILGAPIRKPKQSAVSPAPFVASRAQRRQSAAILSLGTHNAEPTIWERHYLGYEPTPLAMNESPSYNRTSNSVMLPLIKMLTRHYPIAKIEESNFVFSWENLMYMDRKVLMMLYHEPAFSQRFSVHALPLLDADIASHFWQAMAVCKSARDSGLCIAEQLIVFPITNRIVGVFAYKTGQKPVISSYASKLGLAPPTRLAVGKELLRLQHRIHPDRPTVSLSDMISKFNTGPLQVGKTRYKGPGAAYTAVPNGLSWINRLWGNLSEKLTTEERFLENELYGAVQHSNRLETYIRTCYSVRNALEHLLTRFHLDKKHTDAFLPIEISGVAHIVPKLTTYGMTCISSVFLDFKKRLPADKYLQVLMSETSYFEYRSLIEDHLLPGTRPETFMVASVAEGAGVFLFAESIPNSAESRHSNFSETFKRTVGSLKGADHVVLIDATLSELNDPAVVDLLAMIRPFSLKEGFNVVVMQSLAKYFHFGTDLFPGGLFGVCAFHPLPVAEILPETVSERRPSAALSSSQPSLFGKSKRAARATKSGVSVASDSVNEKISHTDAPAGFDPAPIVGMKRAYQKMVQFLLTAPMADFRREYMAIIRENTVALHTAFSRVATKDFRLKEILPGQPYIMIEAYIASDRISSLTKTIGELISWHNLPLTQRQSIGFNLSALTFFSPDVGPDDGRQKTVFFRWVVGGEPLLSRVSDREGRETSLIEAYTNFLRNLGTQIQTKAVV